MLLAPLKWTRKCMFRFLKAYQEHYLGYMANKLHWRKDTQDCESFIAAEFRLWEKKRKRGEREGEKERKYSADILGCACVGGESHTHKKLQSFMQGVWKKKGVKLMVGKSNCNISQQGSLLLLQSAVTGYHAWTFRIQANTTLEGAHVGRLLWCLP